jgi:hypothetical protein
MVGYARAETREYALMEIPDAMFVTVSTAIDGNHYAVITNWGNLIEATYYSTGTTIFVQGDRVFIERIDNQWMISGQAFGPASGGSETNWFTFDTGPGFDVGHFRG